MILLQGAFKASHQYVKYEPNPFKGFGLNFIIDQIKAGKVDKSKILDRVAVLRFCNCLKCLYLCMQFRVMLRTKTRSLCSENVLWNAFWGHFVSNKNLCICYTHKGVCVFFNTETSIFEYCLPKRNVPACSIQRPIRPNLTIPLNRLRSHTTHKVSRSLAKWFWTKT